MGLRRHALTRVAIVLLVLASTALTAPPAVALYEPQLRWGSAGIGESQFSVPLSVAVDHNGNVYVVDPDNYRVQKFTSTGAFVTQWGSNGTGNGQFQFPAGIAVDAAGDVYVTDAARDIVQKFTPTGQYVTKWGSSGGGNGQFGDPRGIAVDGNGNVYVGDDGNDRIQKFDAAGAFVTKWGDSSVFDLIIDVAVAPNGNVYALDLAGSVKRFTATGGPLGSWGGFSQPWGIDVDSAGAVFVADTGNDRVQKFTANGTLLATFGSTGSGPAQLDDPRDVAVGPTGSVFIADGLNVRIQRFRAELPQTSIAGPSGLIRDATPTFTLSSDANPATFECRVKGSGVAFKACSSPYTPTLAEGRSIVLVRAVDGHQLKDATPAEREVRIDTTPPRTRVDSGPGATTKDRTPTFAFTSNERGTFQCRLDGAVFRACTSPRTTRELSLGSHTFRVRAIDRAGNRDATPAVRTFEVVP